MSTPLRLSDVVRSSLNPAWGALAKAVTKRWNAARSPIAAPARKPGTAQSMSTDDDDSLKLLKSLYVEAARNTSPPIQESIPRRRASVDAPKGLPCSPAGASAASDCP